ncbi:MAG TPA: nuclear transport factor 2 family protein [Candidatus Dormibacteraeota bacterium]|nr:nuclear transport factor 2 family protein [Candidatus Dormibacteraeota bacterium]
MTDRAGALTVVRAYHRAWTSQDFDEAGRYLSDDLSTDVPINTYGSKAEWIEAVRGTRQAITSIEVLAEFSNDGEALLLYDMEIKPIGDIRIAEHFTVADGRITGIRHVHDTAALRAAGFAREAQ